MRSTLLLCAALCLVACAGEGAGEDRGPLGKADAFGSCETSDCDGPAADGNCFCDEACESYGDCCEDYVPVCAAPDASACGGLAGLTCDDGEFCEYEPSQMCGAADQLGTCAPRPEVCAQIFDPVCGCDGETYSNACHARAAGTSVVHAGECEPAEPEPDACGGFAGFTCDAGEFCDYEPSQMCGAADQLGTCAPRPQLCPEIYAPVCGCDGETHPNSCFANVAGTSVLHEGACQQPQACGGNSTLECPDGFDCVASPECPEGLTDCPGMCVPA